MKKKKVCDFAMIIIKITIILYLTIIGDCVEISFNYGDSNRSI
jgi:hypothetical protein